MDNHILKIVKLDREPFTVKVNEENFPVIRELLEREKRKIIEKLKKYKSEGLIGSIARPINKHYQIELNVLIEKKRIINTAINNINKLFLSK